MPFTNHLINETSPYLLQHAGNPVNWYPWGDEALNKAKKENKPILVSIGYAACHWCHVMEKESFEDLKTAEIMNENFVNIKIDREERPDLDHIYMDAVQAMTGSGGWPLNVFLTPEKKPFFGGTYFPPQQAYNRSSWKEILLSVTEAFTKRRHEIEAQAENLTEHLIKSNEFGISLPQKKEDSLSPNVINEAYQKVMKVADKEWGGFGRAPKFPQTFTIQFLLRYFHFTGNKDALQQAMLSLDKMIDGGIYDQLGGGFARYSTDTEWLAPHFEKMLYDNALLLSVLSEAYQATGNKRYEEVIAETFAFIKKELLHPKKGFYSALDADSEGIEGKFYVWSRKEVNDLLGKDSELFCDYYDISENGNWEKTNILRVKKSISVFAKEKKIQPDKLKTKLENGKNLLLIERNKRIRPQLDDKIILGWNALMNTACCKAFAATGIDEYLQLAIENMLFLLTGFKTDEENEFYHTWKDDVAKYPAFLDDYAYLIEALINLQELTGDKKWLVKAVDITQHVIQNFSEKETGFFYFTTTNQRDVIVRKKEIYDGATPSGNSVMAINLLKLGILTDQHEWRKRSEDLIFAIEKAAISYPTSFGNWLSLVFQMLKGTNEIAVIGSEAESVSQKILRNYLPHRVLMFSKNEDPAFPLLAGKKGMDKTAIYLCSNYTCFNPVFSTKDLIGLINRAKNE